MSDQNESRDRKGDKWMLLLLVLSLVVGTAGIYSVYRVEHDKTTKVMTQRDAALTSVSSLSTDVETVRGDLHDAKALLAAKDAYITQCVQSLKQAPAQVEKFRLGVEACHQSNTEVAADFQRIKAKAETYPAFDLAVKDFSKPIAVFSGDQCPKMDFSEARWRVVDTTCQLFTDPQYDDEPVFERIVPTVSLIVALAADELHKIANAPASAEDAELTHEQEKQKDPLLAENYFIAGSFLQELFGYNDSIEGYENANYRYVATHLFRLVAPLASDERVVDALGAWVVELISEHRLITGKAGLLARQYLADFWIASWANFWKINEWVEKDTDLYSDYHAACASENEAHCPHLLTDRREGWWYRRWKALKSGEAGDHLIAKYREHMIALAEALGMTAEVKQWRKQMETGRGPTWPRSKPKDSEEEKGEEQ